MANIFTTKGRWDLRGEMVEGDVWVVGLGLDLGMGTAGTNHQWTQIINTVEAQGWRLEQMTAMSAAEGTLGKRNSNMYAVFRRVK